MKGQYFSFDAIIASVIFLLAIVALFSYWYSVKTYLDYQNEDLSKEAARIANVIFGPPSSTVCANMERIGLGISFDDRRLSEANLNCFERSSRVDENWLKARLASPYNVSIKVRTIGTPTRSVVIAPPPSEQAREVVTLRRLGTLYNQSSGASTSAIFDISVYR